MSEEQKRQEIREKIRKLKKNWFKQQNLYYWKPTPSYGCAMSMFFGFAIFFVAFGISLYVMSDHVQEAKLNYNPLCGAPGEDGTTCEVTLSLSEEFVAPIFVYYQLGNFYQNHRAYVLSVSPEQQRGNNLTFSEVESECTPAITNDQMGKKIAADGVTPLIGSEVAYPCGVIAKTYFSDYFDLTDPNGDDVFINQTGIAWETDREFKFKNLDDENWDQWQWQDVEDEHYIIWMRIAALPSFRKLWGRIDTNLPAGDYSLTVQNNFDVDSFKGTKVFMLSTTNQLGGHNYFLAICYISVGAICLMFGFIFFGAYISRHSQVN